MLELAAKPDEDECSHNNTHFQHLRCDVCDDCGKIVDIDV